MLRKFALAASAVALAGGSLALSAGPATAGAPPINAGAGSSLSCDNIKASVKLNPKLKDDWVKSEHSGDSNAAVRAIPNTQFAPTAAENVIGKASSASCSGSIAKSGPTTSHIVKIKATMVSDPAHPTTDPDSCTGLVNSTVGGTSTARYNVTIKYTVAAGNAKVNPTTISHAEISSQPGYLFTVSNGTVTGSFAGSSDFAINANVDTATTQLFASVAARQVATSSHPKAYNACEPGLKIKGSTATLVPPKGVSKIGIDPANTTVTGTR